MCGCSCSGIGLALCERLLSQDTEGLQLCLACRNMRRAQSARAALLTSHPTAQVALLQMDTSSITSVLSAAQEVKLRWEDRLTAAWCSNTHSDPNSHMCFMYIRKLQNKIAMTLFVNRRYNRLDYLYLNAGIMPNPQFDVKAFFKGLFSRYSVCFRCSHGAASLDLFVKTTEAFKSVSSATLGGFL